MNFAFAKAARLIEADLMDSSMTSDMDGAEHVSPRTLDRPTNHQPPVQTDGLDPAALGGPSPMNSAQGPYGAPVASDPLLEDPIRPGAPVTHIQGPDLDALTLN